MRKLKARKLKVIAGDGPTLRELFDLARRLVQGRGPGKQYLNEAESANYEKPVYGVAGFNTSVDLERGHEPLEAMVMAGFILFGPTWVASFKAMEVPTDLHRAYFDLEHHFAPKAPPVQIPEPVKKVGITAVHISLPEPPKPARTKKKTTAVTDQPKHARIEGGPERIALPGQ